MTIAYAIDKEQRIGTSRKNILVVLRNDTPAVAYRRFEAALVPLSTVAADYIAALDIQTMWDAGTALSAVDIQGLEDRRDAAGNALENRTLAEALAYIDAASTLAALRLILKEIVKELYLIRRVLEKHIRNGS